MHVCTITSVTIIEACPPGKIDCVELCYTVESRTSKDLVFLYGVVLCQWMLREFRRGRKLVCNPPRLWICLPIFTIYIQQSWQKLTIRNRCLNSRSTFLVLFISKLVDRSKTYTLWLFYVAMDDHLFDM